MSECCDWDVKNVRSNQWKKKKNAVCTYTGTLVWTNTVGASRTWFLPWFSECCTVSGKKAVRCTHSAWCNLCACSLYYIYKVLLYIHFHFQCKQLRETIALLILFYVILGLLDSCIILLHFILNSDLYFIRYGCFCLHSPGFFYSVIVCACICMSGLPFILLFFRVIFIFLLHFTSVFMIVYRFLWVYFSAS